MKRPLHHEQTLFETAREPFQSPGERAERFAHGLADQVVVRIHLQMHGARAHGGVEDFQEQLAQRVQGFAGDVAGFFE